MTHNYPKTRKKFSGSQTQMLLASLGEDALYKIWCQWGMYKSPDKIFEIIGWYPSYWVIRYLSNLFDWKRTITDKTLPIYQGVLNGTVSKNYYKHINFQ